jgi:hypothetical protein
MKVINAHRSHGMQITLNDLASRAGPFEIVVDSIEGSIYRASVIIDGKELRVVGETGQTLQGRSITALQEKLNAVAVLRVTLRQRSAYDEMIGQPPRATDNALEVPLARVLT